MTENDTTRLYLIRVMREQRQKWGRTETVELFSGEEIGLALNFATDARNAAAKLDLLLFDQAQRAGVSVRQCWLAVRTQDGALRFRWCP